MKKIFKKFQVKDFVFLAVLSAAMTLCGGITMPLVMHTTVFGLRNMAAAPIYSIFVAIGLMKVRKPGALTIIGLFSGAPLIFFSTVMFFNNFVSAIIAELIMLLIFRGYQKKVSVFVTTGIYMPFSLPISVLFSLWLNGAKLRSAYSKSENFCFNINRHNCIGIFGRGNRNENCKRTSKSRQAEALRKRKRCLKHLKLKSRFIHLCRFRCR